MDWNRDGKYDWQDDAIFHEVIRDPEDLNEEHSDSAPKPKGSSGTRWSTTILTLLYLDLLLPGKIPVNSITMLIGFVCIVALIRIWAT